MTITIRPSVAELPVSATLRANQAAAERRQRGERVLHMGFGQAPFPVHPKLSAALAEHAGANLYEPVGGVESVRETARTYFASRMHLDPDAYDVIVAPGSKLIIYALQMAIAGDVIIPVPSWVSYVPQASLLGDRVIPVAATLDDRGYRLSAEQLQQCIERARRDGASPSKIILNSPNNPTGLCLTAEDRIAIAGVCEDNDIVIISDEIYAFTQFDRGHHSIGGAAPSAAVTTGLSKHVSLGGWRIGFGLIPRHVDGLYEAVRAIASETWSAVSAPIQRAAQVAVSGDPAIESFIDTSTRIHAAVVNEVAQRLRDAGIVCPLPSGGFYLWPDYGPFRESLKKHGITTSVQLADALLAQTGVLALPGSAFGAPAEQLALRLSLTDYDGAHALQLAADMTTPVPPLAQIAPRVDEAATALAGFASAHR